MSPSPPSAATPTTEAIPMTSDRVDVIEVMDTDGEAVMAVIDTCGGGTLRERQWVAHLTKHDAARAAVAELIATLNAIAQMSPMQVMNLKAKVGSPDATGWNFAIAAKAALASLGAKP